MNSFTIFLGTKNARFAIIVLAAILFIPFLGNVHLFDWDEINFAECAREMIASGDYFRPQINFQPFWEKPPLFIWLQVAAMKVFGINEFAARLPNAIIGLVTIWLAGNAGHKIYNLRTGNLFALFFLISWLPHLYFKSGIIDPVFNLFIFLGFYQFYLAVKDDHRFLHPALSGLFIGLAILTKGPAALLIFGMAVLIFLILFRGFRHIKGYSLLVLIITILLTVSCWFGIYFVLDGSWFIREFISYQIRLFTTRDAGHGGPFFYHFIVLLLGCFPASVLLFQYRRSEFDKFSEFTFRAWMWVMFWLVLILFSVVKTKIVHYSSLCYFPLCYLAAQYMDEILNKERKVTSITRIIFLITGLIWSLILIILPIIGLEKELIIPYIKDPFAVANLAADVSWHFWEVIPGVIYLAIIIWLYIIFQKKINQFFTFLALSQLIIIPFVIIYFTPKIEAISQRAAIDFYHQFAGERVIIRTVDFKSYAHLFYASLPANMPKYTNNWEELLQIKTTIPIYLVTKIQNRAKLDTVSNLTFLNEKNGFVFYKKND